jgi:hypothetical protein
LVLLPVGYDLDKRRSWEPFPFIDGTSNTCQYVFLFYRRYEGLPKCFSKFITNQIFVMNYFLVYFWYSNFQYLQSSRIQSYAYP